MIFTLWNYFKLRMNAQARTPPTYTRFSFSELTAGASCAWGRARCACSKRGRKYMCHTFKHMLKGGPFSRRHPPTKSQHLPMTSTRPRQIPYSLFPLSFSAFCLSVQHTWVLWKLDFISEARGCLTLSPPVLSYHNYRQLSRLGRWRDGFVSSLISSNYSFPFVLFSNVKYGFGPLSPSRSDICSFVLTTICSLQWTLACAKT